MLKNIEVPRPYHLEIDGKIYDLRWIKFTFELLVGLAFIVSLYVFWLLMMVI